ncbi:MAG TPA: hypothetical protein VGS96_04495, partial [Thermoanaerobaculia bacterium]|nr:hypothetical protein [Thermoanaerobaculia bacterium]
MRRDAPAALPLIAFVAGLLLNGGVATVLAFAVVSALIWRLHRHASIAIAFLALGMLLALRSQPQIATSDRFTSIEVPIESDWSARDHFYVLR